MRANEIIQKAEREAIIANLTTICELLHIDGNLTKEEQLVELLRISLFERHTLTNPACPFKDKVKEGEYDNVPDEEYEAEKAQIIKISDLFRNNREIKPFEFIHEAIINLDPNDPVRLPDGITM